MNTNLKQDRRNVRRRLKHVSKSAYTPEQIQLISTFLSIRKSQCLQAITTIANMAEGNSHEFFVNSEKYYRWTIGTINYLIGSLTRNRSKEHAKSKPKNKDSKRNDSRRNIGIRPVRKGDSET